MKKHFTTLLSALLFVSHAMMALSFELNRSYDFFRGLPDGSWNGNSGAFVAGNIGWCPYERVGLQAGASYGVYNWDGRGNLVFKNNKKVLQQGFASAGFFTTFGQFNGGLLYDRLFSDNYGIYALSPSVDQLRFQAGYQFWCEELGLWGTAALTTSHKEALGVPISFRAISQLNVFWTHFFSDNAKATLWLGAPYRDSLMYRHKTAGTIIAGFELRAPLTQCLYVDGHGTYMASSKCHGDGQCRGYGSNVCVGITYIYGNKAGAYGSAYMPLADNSNFMVDTNISQ